MHSSHQWAQPTDLPRDDVGLGPEELFGQVAVPVAEELTRGAWLGPWRLMAIDGFEWDAPDSKENAAEFGYAGSGADRSAFPKVRVVSVSECASHAVVDAEMGGITGKGSGEQTLWGSITRPVALTCGLSCCRFVAARRSSADSYGQYPWRRGPDEVEAFTTMLVEAAPAIAQTRGEL